MSSALVWEQLRRSMPSTSSVPSSLLTPQPATTAAGGVTGTKRRRASKAGPQHAHSALVAELEAEGKGVDMYAYNVKFLASHGTSSRGVATFKRELQRSKTHSTANSAGKKSPPTLVLKKKKKAPSVSAGAPKKKV